MAAIKFQKPSLFRKDLDAVLETMVDDKIGPGEKKRAFVKAYSSYAGKSDGAALRTFRDALSIALDSMGIVKGDSVALSVLSPEIYSTVLKEKGIGLYLLDTDPSLLPSLDGVRKGMEEGVKALIYFEPIGVLPENIGEVRELGIPVIEDITQSVGSLDGEIRPGQAGDIVIASTEEDALVSTAGGAVILTSNESYADYISKVLTPYIEMADMNAALGLVQLEQLQGVVARRSGIWKKYAGEAWKKNRVKVLGRSGADYQGNGYAFSVIANDRPDEVAEMARKYQVSVQKTFGKAIGRNYQDRYDRFPNAVPALSRAISFPLYPLLLSSEVMAVEKVVGMLR